MARSKTEDSDLFKLPDNAKCKVLEMLIRDIGSHIESDLPALELNALISHWIEELDFDTDRYGVPKLKLYEALQYAQDRSGLTRSEILGQEPFPKNKLPSFQFIDLFSGIGGFRLALQAEGGNCRFSSEWDNSARQTYFSNYGVIPFGDINQFTREESSDKNIAQLIPSHDVLAAGFPCQPFSLAGVSARNSLGMAHGFECKTQGTLFHSVARIAKAIQPKILLLENVRNIVSHDSGKTFETIKRTVDEIGYDFSYELINSSSVVPQRRIRCYMVCVRKDIKEKFGEYKYPDFSGSPMALESILDPNPPSHFTISDKLWKGHQDRTERNLNRGAGFTAHTAQLDKPSKTIVARYYKDGKECLIPQEGKNPRLLTINECRQLFGYPEGFVSAASRTASYKQFGNSVVVPVITRLVKQIVYQYQLSKTSVEEIKCAESA